MTTLCRSGVGSFNPFTTTQTNGLSKWALIDWDVIELNALSSTNTLLLRAESLSLNKLTELTRYKTTSNAIPQNMGGQLGSILDGLSNNFFSNHMQLFLPASLLVSVSPHPNWAQLCPPWGRIFLQHNFLYQSTDIAKEKTQTNTWEKIISTSHICETVTTPPWI